MGERRFAIRVLARIGVGLVLAAEASAFPSIDVQLGGYLLVIPEAVGSRENVLNQGNQLGVPVYSGETAIGLEGSIEQITWRARGTGIQERANGSWNLDWDLQMQELARTFDLGADWQFVIGKRTLTWDVGYSLLPLGFFEKETDFTDLFDRYGRTEGLPLVGLTYYGDGWDVSAVYSWDFESDPDGFNRGLRQWALNANAIWRGTRFSLVVQQPEGQPVGIGGAFSTVLSNGLELHGSVFSRRGTRRPIHRLVDSGAIGFVFDDPYSDFRIEDGLWYPRSVLGLQWTGRSGVSMILEWTHDERGLDGREWDHWQELVEFHDRGGPPVPFEGRQANLAQDARTLLRTGTREDYLFLQIRRPFGNFEPSLSTRIGLADGSAFVNARLIWSPSGNWSADLFVNGTGGPSGSEFGMIPVQWSAGLSLILSF